eukprot:gene2328-4528_t
MEFDKALSAYVYAILCKQEQYINPVQSFDDNPHELNPGVCFTSKGPAQYNGNILDSPDLVWSEDMWNDDRYQEALQRLESQGKSSVVSQFWRTKYENEAGRFWHDFYKRNADNFYKDRHYLHVVFPELDPAHTWIYNIKSSNEETSLRNSLNLLEVGCGVGNAIIPLLDLHPRLRVYAIDFAKSAVDILRTHIMASTPCVTPDGKFDNGFRLQVDQCDVARESLPVTPGSVHLVLCMFVLSAISPN